MTKYVKNYILDDKVTRIIIPNTTTLIATLATNLVSRWTDENNPDIGFFKRIATSTFRQRDDRTNSETNPMSFVDGILAILSIGFGVTSISSSRSYTMPFSKGIGSNSQTIHLLGANNETMDINFHTDQYPGFMGFVIRQILNSVLENADILYIVDDMHVATPCLLMNFQLKKEAQYRGAIKGTMKLVILPTSSNPFTNIKNNGLASEVKRLSLGAKGLSSAIKSTSFGWMANIAVSVSSKSIFGGI